MHAPINDKLVREFIANSGFSVLALAKLSPCEYAIFLFLFQRAAMGLDQMISNERELAQVLDFANDDITAGVKKLAQLHLIKVHYGHHDHTLESHPSLYLQIQCDLDRWILNPHARNEKVGVWNSSADDEQEKVGVLNLKKKAPKAPAVVAGGKSSATWKRIYQAFTQYHEDGEDRSLQQKSRPAAESLVARHPVDQVLLMIHHFGQRLPSLSELLKKWEHYQELFEQETQQIDMDQAREKHGELDTTLRGRISSWLNNAKERELTSEEIEVLRMIEAHRFPRRQLFWAYQARSRYLNLREFFEENMPLMLAVSSSGVVLKKPKN
jgi:hypothetical protein